MKAMQLIKEQYSVDKKISTIGKKASIVLGTTTLFLSGMPAMAQSQTINNVPTNENLLEQVDLYQQENSANSLNQVNNVSQLRDVTPTDWAYEALRGLVDRYGCISGFPNQTYRGNQPLSRYEFAAGLNSCLNQIERLIASSENVIQQDLDTMQRLTQEFEAELATLGTRVDELENRTAFLEDHQFSTTTKLTGEAVFSLTDIFTGDDALGNDLETETVFGYRSRLAFNGSFTGEDLLFVQLTAGNFPFLSEQTLTAEGDLGLYGTGPNGQENNLDVLVALYSFPIGDRTTVVLEGVGGIAFDFTDTINALDGYNDTASGAISTFGQRNPIYNFVAGAGVGLRSELSDSFEISAGYLAPNAQDPADEQGLFNGAYSALGQLVFKPGDKFKLGLTYVNAYNVTSNFTGSNLTNLGLDAQFNRVEDVSSNSYGVQLSYALSDRFIIGGWGGYTANKVRELDGKQEIWNWAATLAFPDLFKEGSLGGIVVGMEPKVTDSNIPGFDQTDQDTSLHIEAFYQYPINDNIAITPGAIWITAPDHNSNNDDTVIGTLRTTFTF